MANLSMKENDKGEIRPVKHSAGERIDVACAFLLAWLAWFHGRDDGYRGDVIAA